ncbi:MAG: hypothetical protein WKG32_14280 [Gemmatimonadaceae bacterium]
MWIAAAVLLIAHAVLAWLMRIPAITTGNDDAVYLHLARSLRELGYNDRFLVSAPVHAQYPPGYPVMLALLGALAGERLDVFLAAGVALSVGALALFFDAVRRLWTPALALMALALASVNVLVLANAGRLMTETPFMALTVGALWLLSRRPATRWTLVLAGAAVIAAALTRTVGVTLVVAVIALWLVERRIRAAATLAVVSALTVGAWLLWTVLSPAKSVGRSYVADAGAAIAPTAVTASGGLLGRLQYNAVDYLTRQIPFALPVPTVAGTRVDNVFWLLVILALGALGSYALWRRWRASFFALAAYFALLLVWTWTFGRLLEPLLPLLLLALLAGAALAGRRFGPRAEWALPLALTLVIGATSLTQTAAALKIAARCDRAHQFRLTAGCFEPARIAFVASAEFARTRTDPTAVFASGKEGAFAYHSNRRLVPLASLLDADSSQILARLAAMRVDYVMLGGFLVKEHRLATQLLPICDRLALVADFPPRAIMLRVRDDAPPGSDRRACDALAQYVARSPSKPAGT